MRHRRRDEKWKGTPPQSEFQCYTIEKDTVCGLSAVFCKAGAYQDAVTLPWRVPEKSGEPLRRKSGGKNKKNETVVCPDLDREAGTG